MDLTDVVLRRRMVRHFSTDPVDPAAVDRILELARHAPSAGFTQGQSFLVVTDLDRRTTIARLCGEDEYVEGGFHPFISGAPVLLIPCTSELAYHRRYQEADKVDEDGSETEWPVPYWHMDIGCSVMLVLLGAVDEGLAAGFAGAPTSHRMQQLRDLLGIPADVTPVGVIPLGHSLPDTPSPSLKRGRKPTADFIHREHW